MSVIEDETTETDERSEGYRSPALSRLQDAPPRQVAPIRQIAEVGRNLPVDAAAERLAALEERLAQLEQQQLALVANLHEAHEAFCQLAERVSQWSAARGQWSGAGGGSPPGPPADQARIKGQPEPHH